MLAAVPAIGAPIALVLDTAYTQNFDTLPQSGSVVWVNDSTIAGWYSVRTGTGTTIVADTGAGNGGNLYSYGSAAAVTDRALGTLGSGNTAAGSFFHGVALHNGTGATITSLDVAYVGEQWRSGGATSGAQTIAFSYLVGTPTVTGSLAEFQTAGVPVTSIDFTSPIINATAGALDGNAAANRATKTFTITGLSIPDGTDMMLRWSDPDQTGSDHGLAIDDFSLTPHGGVPLPALSIDDVTHNEGNAGTTTYTFTVTLSAMSASNVTFDIATADNTATSPSDYTPKSLTTQTIPAGSTTYTFDVLVNGDTLPETNESFFVNLASASGATIADGQGVGTITNDDAAPSLTIADVSHNEGNAGTTTYTFTVSLDTPATAGGVSFDIATADGSATSPSDFTSRSLTAQTIPAGSTTYTFDVSVNGDTTTEPDETFTVNVTNLSGNAILTDGQAIGTIVNDDIQKIHDVQGSGAATPIPGATVTVEGVATAVFLGATKLNGFFLQEEDVDADADPNTSEGIFILCSSCVAGVVSEGQRVRVTGSATEFNGMTEIASTAVLVTDAGNHLAEVTPAPITLPIVGDVDAFYEAREGMLITYVDTLTVSEYFELFRFGQIQLVGGDRPRTYTEDNAPSVAGYATHLQDLARRRVILDDDNNAQEAPLLQPNGNQATYYPRANGGFSAGTQGVDYFRGGDVVNGLTGVLQWGYPGFGANTWRIRPTAAHPVAFTVANPRPATPPVVGGSIRAVGMNLLNYFTTIDTTSSNSSGPCGPTGTLDCRGADSVAELNRQRERASVVVCTLNPDVSAFMELENTTPSATITDLLGAVNARCGGAHPYAFINTGGTLGTDAIRVAQIYRTGVLSPVGSPLVDLDPIHNRPPTAQTYDVVDASNPAFGQRFTVIANHFKSKGSCPTSGADIDQLDGQSCWASTRTQQATRLLSWINGTVIPAAGDPDVLLLGDFNSYAHETPVTTLESGGYHDLETELHGVNSYSYLFSGELGHLDFAFASNSFASQVTGADAWHINADEVDLFDYNDEIKDIGEAAFEEKPDGSALVPPRVVFEPMTPYRASDHDPVLVGLFGATDVAISMTDAPDPVVAGSNITYTITATNNGPLNADAAAWTDALPAGTTFSSLVTPAGWSCTNPGVGVNGNINCSALGSFAVGNATFTLVVTVAPSVADGSVLSNTATISTTTSDTNASNNSATATTNVAASADLGIGHFGPTDVVAGDNVTYTIIVANGGPSSAPSVLTDALPSEATFVSLVVPPGWSCTTPTVGSSGTVSCNRAFMLVDESAWFTIVANVPASVPEGTAISNSATVSSAVADPNLGNNGGALMTTVHTAPQGHLTITPSSVPFGNQAVGTTSAPMTVTLANVGTSSLDVTSLTAAALPFARSGGSCAATPPITLAAGASCTLFYTFTPDAAWSPTQTLNVVANAPGSGPIVLSGTGVQVGNLVITPDPLVFATQVVGTTSAAQTVTLSNSGSASLDVTALSTPTGAFASASGGTCPALPITLATGANCTLMYTFTPSSAGVVNQVLSVSSNAAGNTSLTLSGTGASPQADVSVSITDNRHIVQVGDTLDYVLTVSNASGPGTAIATVGDALPASLTAGSWTCVPTGAATCANGSGNVLSDVATLPAGTHVTYVYSATVQLTASELIANSATATVSAGVIDPNPVNNTAADTPVDVVVIFTDGFEDSGVTLALDGYSDGAGFVSAQLLLNPALLNGLGVAPVAIATGETASAKTAFTIELARFNGQIVMRLLTRDANGGNERSEWRAIDASAHALDFAWLSATAGKADGYVRLAAGASALQSEARADSERLLRLHVTVSNGAAWLSFLKD